MRSEFCIDCIEAIDTKAESRISTVGEWVKFVDLKMDQIDKIDPKVCRQFGEQFSLENVAPKYEKYFQDVLNVYTGKGWYEL